MGAEKTAGADREYTMPMRCKLGQHLLRTLVAKFPVDDGERNNVRKTSARLHRDRRKALLNPGHVIAQNLPEPPRGGTQYSHDSGVMILAVERGEL